MEQIKIIFFALSTFFGVEDGRIAAEMTTVTVVPQENRIEIIHDNLVSVLRDKSDTLHIKKQWEAIANWEAQNTPWAKELNTFAAKELRIATVAGKLQTTVLLTYTNPEQLRTMGIWYNKEKKQFALNESPQQHLKTQNGMQEDNYWVFKDDEAFSFTLAPFTDIPEAYKNRKPPLEKFIDPK